MLFEREPPKLQRLLVVEDEPLVAFDNEHFLQTHGYTVVETVDTADAAKTLIEAGGIDLVLLDVRLNDSDGRDVALVAKADGIPVLFVTARCPADARDIAAGCLGKPYQPRDLQLAIEAITARLDGRKPGRLPKGLTLYL